MDDDNPDVIRIANFNSKDIGNLLGQFRLKFCLIDDYMPIPGSFWGDDEAGLIGDSLFYRQDTPVHSILHETAHYICLDTTRRQDLDTNAASDIAEENAVCYLQVLLARKLNTYGEGQLFADMDRWGYSFRLGSSSRWFYEDAEDAKDWLTAQNLVTESEQIRGNLRS